jgi:DNA-directed RNA polymerase specialized sigma24 family protein
MRGVYLVPPMDDEPPPDFVDFVRARLGDLQREAARLTGGTDHADEVYPEALADVASHWRRQRSRGRMPGAAPTTTAGLERQ